MFAEAEVSAEGEMREGKVVLKEAIAMLVFATLSFFS